MHFSVPLTLDLDIGLTAKNMLAEDLNVFTWLDMLLMQLGSTLREANPTYLLVQGGGESVEPTWSNLVPRDKSHPAQSS